LLEYAGWLSSVATLGEEIKELPVEVGMFHGGHGNLVMQLAAHCGFWSGFGFGSGFVDHG
jgi:hypothetical protein